MAYTEMATKNFGGAEISFYYETINTGTEQVVNLKAVVAPYPAVPTDGNPNLNYILNIVNVNGKQISYSYIKNDGLSTWEEPYEAEYSTSVTTYTDTATSLDGKTDISVSFWVMAFGAPDGISVVEDEKYNFQIPVLPPTDVIVGWDREFSLTEETRVYFGADPAKTYDLSFSAVPPAGGSVRPGVIIQNYASGDAIVFNASQVSTIIGYRQAQIPTPGNTAPVLICLLEHIESGVYPTPLNYLSRASATAKLTEPSAYFGEAALAYYDGNGAVTAVTENDQIIVQNQSELYVHCDDPMLKYGGSITNYTLTVNGEVKYFGLSAPDYPFYCGKYDMSADFDIVVSVEDSYLGKASITKTVNIEAWRPVDGAVSCKRVDGFDAETKYSASPRYSSIAGKNTISIVGVFKQGDTEVIQPHVMQPNTEYSANLDQSMEYTFTVTFADAFTQKVITKTIPAAIPAVFLDDQRRRASINGFPNGDATLSVWGDLFVSGGIGEVGTWTPTFSTANVTSYNYNWGTYIKIGKLVYINFALYANWTNSSTNYIQISGLPFTPKEQASGSGWISAYHTPAETDKFCGWHIYPAGVILPTIEFVSGDRWTDDYRATYGYGSVTVAGGTAVYEIA